MFNYSKYNINNDNVNYGRIDYCPILDHTAQILRPFATAGNKSEYQKYINRYGYHNGVDLVPYNDNATLSESDYIVPAYSPAMGIVLSVSDYTIPETGSTGAIKSVVIQYDAETSFRVGNLTETFVTPGQTVTQYDLIGNAKKWVHFEMLTYAREYNTSVMFTFNKLKLFIANPMNYFTGNYSGLNEGVG